VATNVLLREMNVEGVAANDGRNIEVLANGLPLWNGAQLAVDTTLVCPLDWNGVPLGRAADTDGAQLTEARRNKEETYSELHKADGAA